MVQCIALSVVKTQWQVEFGVEDEPLAAFPA